MTEDNSDEVSGEELLIQDVEENPERHDVTLAHTTFMKASCPHCDRRERFEHELTARAWLTGHIQEEHPDKLPPFEGTGE